MFGLLLISNALLLTTFAEAGGKDGGNGGHGGTAGGNGGNGGNAG